MFCFLEIHLTRPAIANERLTLNNAGQVKLMLKVPYQDGTPLEFMHRLAALIPPPRLKLIRFHGVLAPNPKLRPNIISGEKKGKSSPSDANEDAQYPPVYVRISWTRLLKQVFDIDIEHCPHCGGDMKIILAILESSVITKLFNYLALPARAPAQIHDLFEPT